MSDEFYNCIEQLPKEVTNRDLEAYLLALYGVVEQYKEIPFSPTLCLELLKEAFSAKTATYEEQWTSIRTMPEETEYLSAFAYTQAVILFQIAELHRMKDKELHNEMRSFGITSETGYDWYNFTPLDLLECGARGLCDYIGEDETIPNDWHFLGHLLDLGRYYE
jgi:hypothetical protein